MSAETDLLDTLLTKGVFDYGEIIKVDALMELFGVKTTSDDEMEGMSPNDMRALIKKEAVLELSVAGKVRERLLDEGRYLGKHGEYYRVYLPSENVSQAAAYQAAGQKRTLAQCAFLRQRLWNTRTKRQQYLDLPSPKSYRIATAAKNDN